MRRRAAHGILGRIRLGTAGNSPRLRRWALAVVLLGVAWLTGRLLDRRRMTRWATEWSAVEPQWTKRTH
jgi:hypothetical protein